MRLWIGQSPIFWTGPSLLYWEMPPPLVLYFVGSPKDLFCIQYTWYTWYRIDFQQNLDETQVGVLIKPGTMDASCVMFCLSEIKNWASKNFLESNDTKLDVTISPVPAALITSPLVWVPYVIFDWEVYFDARVTSVLLCSIETGNQDQVISFPCKLRKGHPCFYLLQSWIMQCTNF